MNPEQYRMAYEQIDNQILRILLCFGGAVILTLSSALAYLWHSWRAEQKERINLDVINASAMNAVANELDHLRERLESFERLLTEKSTTHRHEK